MKANVIVTLKNGVLDPQGVAIESTLAHMGFAGISARVGKFITLEVAESDSAKARAMIEQMCEKLLVNTVIEKYTIELAE